MTDDDPFRNCIMNRLANYKLLVLLSLLLALASCATDQPNFISMSEAELLAYNKDRPVLNQIFCQEMRTTSSHIPRKVCREVEDWVQHNMRTLMAIDTISVGSYSVFGSTFD